MEWAENEELTNDRCSTASSISNSGEVTSGLSVHSNGPKAVNSQSLNGNQSNQTNSNTSLNLDSMSDGELSDFSLNDTDDEEFRSTSNSGKILLHNVFLFHCDEFNCFNSFSLALMAFWKAFFSKKNSRFSFENSFFENWVLFVLNKIWKKRRENLWILWGMIIL